MQFYTYRAIRLDNAILKKRQYLGLKPLLRKRCYYELNRAARQINADLKRRYLGLKPLLRKRCYYELNRAARQINADLKRRYIPQTS